MDSPRKTGCCRWPWLHRWSPRVRPALFLFRQWWGATSGETPPLVHSLPWSNQLGSKPIRSNAIRSQLSWRYQPKLYLVKETQILGLIQRLELSWFCGASHRQHFIIHPFNPTVSAETFLQRFPFDASEAGREKEELAGLILSRLGASFGHRPSPVSLSLSTFSSSIFWSDQHWTFINVINILLCQRNLVMTSNALDSLQNVLSFCWTHASNPYQLDSTYQKWNSSAFCYSEFVFSLYEQVGERPPLARDKN